MPDTTNTAVGSFVQNVATIAKNDALKGFIPTLDAFLTAVIGNQGGKEGLLLIAQALPGNLLAALPQVEAQAGKDIASEAKTQLDAVAAKAETPVVGG